MSYDKKCRFCGSPLDIAIHGNRKHCDDDCSYEAKKSRTNNNYWEQTKKLEEFKKSDTILKLFFDTYGSEKYIPSDLLDSAGLNWDISREKINIGKIIVTVIDRFGYALFNNQTVKIWKIQYP